MAFARKVPIKKINEVSRSLLTFGDFFNHLFNTFTSFQKHCDSIHIIFDLYKTHSTKDSARQNRYKVGYINIAISSFSQKLPVELDKYWNLNLNKIRFQQSFIQWITENYEGSKFIILGGGSKQNPNECLVVSNKIVSKIIFLESTHEEADDRIMLHVEYEVMNGAKSIMVASTDTDILAFLLYHCVRWIKDGLCFFMEC